MKIYPKSSKTGALKKGSRVYLCIWELSPPIETSHPSDILHYTHICVRPKAQNEKFSFSWNNFVKDVKKRKNWKREFSFFRTFTSIRCFSGRKKKTKIDNNTQNDFDGKNSFVSFKDWRNDAALHSWYTLTTAWNYRKLISSFTKA